MSELHMYGVECKNTECGKGIVLGDYLTNPTHGGDVIEFVSVKKPGKEKCPGCSKEYEYGHGDLRDFGKSQ